MSDLDSSSAHRDKGLLTPLWRKHHLRRIIQELRPPGVVEEVDELEVSGAQDLCYRLYSEEVADLMAARLGVTRQQIREALDAGIKWELPVSPHRAEEV